MPIQLGAVVIATGCYSDLIFMNFVDQSVLLGNPTRPISMESKAKRLRFPNALVAVELDIPDEIVDTLKDSLILSLPPEVVVPGGFVPNDLHSTRSRAAPLPCSSLSMDARRRRAFSGF